MLRELHKGRKPPPRGPLSVVPAPVQAREGASVSIGGRRPRVWEAEVFGASRAESALAFGQPCLPGSSLGPIGERDVSALLWLGLWVCR